MTAGAADDTAKSDQSGDGKFGACCAELKEAIAGGDFEPLITVGDEDVLYMTVGLVDVEDDESAFVDHPIFFCPFCGTGIQDRDEVKAKLGDAGGEDEA